MVYGPCFRVRVVLKVWNNCIKKLLVLHGDPIALGIQNHGFLIMSVTAASSHAAVKLLGGRSL